MAVMGWIIEVGPLCRGFWELQSNLFAFPLFEEIHSKNEIFKLTVNPRFLKMQPG